MLNSDALTYEVKTIRGKAAVAAGTSDQHSSTIDMAGYDAVRCIALLGTLTATQVTKLLAQGGAAANGSDKAPITGAETAAAADTDSDKILILDVIQPRQRYITFTIDRGTANAVIDGMIIELYKARERAQSADSTVSQQAVAVPAA